ncbi:MAG: RHS repeat-associated core domain-containing protein [Dehalococcoidia bacterium]|nr:RHS repeat-associated core domain-containing protein [Dehalococcoidia bacterium]
MATNPTQYEATYPDCEILHGDINGDGVTDIFDIDPWVALMTAGGYSYPEFVCVTLEYDAENRLIAWYVTNPSSISDVKVTFEYDYLGRRIRKEVRRWVNGAWQTNPLIYSTFLYDGWRPIMEWGKEDNAMGIAVDFTRRYTWGPDLSGTLDGAGGIGGLLAMKRNIVQPGGVSTVNYDYVYTYDANGNVGQLVSFTPTTWNASAVMVARYEYDPYGKVTNSAGDYADRNPIRFSTKYWDDETGLGYWGYRYYDPATGRWMTRDPIEERGGDNLYVYIAGSVTFAVDAIGEGLFLPGPKFRPKMSMRPSLPEDDTKDATGYSMTLLNLFAASTVKLDQSDSLSQILMPTPYGALFAVGNAAVNGNICTCGDECFVQIAISGSLGVKWQVGGKWGTPKGGPGKRVYSPSEKRHIPANLNTKTKNDGLLGRECLNRDRVKYRLPADSGYTGGLSSGTPTGTMADCDCLFNEWDLSMTGSVSASIGAYAGVSATGSCTWTEFGKWPECTGSVFGGVGIYGVQVSVTGTGNFTYYDAIPLRNAYGH